METDFDPGPLAAVTGTRESDGHTLEFVRDLRHPVERVWRALTVPDEVARWAPFRPDRNLDSPGPMALVMIDGMSEDRLDGEVLVAVAPARLEYTWADGIVRWALADRPDGMRLTLRHTVAEPDLLPKLAAGWHLCLFAADALMAGRATPDMTGANAMDFGWQALHDAYARALG